MLLLIDNYDSFTYNLYHYLQEIGAEVEVHRNDAITVPAIREKHPQGIVISPGPCTPNEAGICLDVINMLHKTIPILGVCLGHQAIGQVFGGTIIHGQKPVHAQVTAIHHQENNPLFNKIPSPFNATRYHSLIIDPSSLPSCLKTIAHSDDGVIQAIAHLNKPVWGVQFHPESITSEYGHQLLDNFYSICKNHS